uniref:Nucleotide-diphospho-sugar transferase domain-containing protein n=1 Tax=viral metagenome TaxID=1070528 RepID=A0A6C0AIV1_9ZZZZ
MNTPVIVSFANIGYRIFSENLLRNLRDKIHKHRAVFYCLDKELYDVLLPYSTDNIQVILYQETSGIKDFVDFGNSDGFRDLMRIKTDILIKAVKEYSFIHFIDGDVVFYREPPEDYYAKYSDYDIIYQGETCIPDPQFITWTCTGNFVLRNTERTITLLKLIQEYQDKHSVAEQEAQRLIFSDSNITDIRNYPHANLTEFPREEVTPGCMVNKIDKNRIILFHANHTVGFNNKRDILKYAGMWYMG